MDGERERNYSGRVPRVLAALMTEDKSLFSNSNEFNYDLPLARCLDQLMSGFINCQLNQNQVQAPKLSHFSLQTLKRKLTVCVELFDDSRGKKKINPGWK